MPLKNLFYCLALLLAPMAYAAEGDNNSGGTEAADLFATDADEAAAANAELEKKPWYWSPFSCIGLKQAEVAARPKEAAPFGFDVRASFIEFDYQNQDGKDKFTGFIVSPFVDRRYTEKKVPVVNIMMHKLRERFAADAATKEIAEGSEEFDAFMDRKAKVVSMLTGIAQSDVFGKLANETDVWYRYHDVYGYDRTEARNMELVTDASEEEAKQVAASMRGIMSQQILMQRMSPNVDEEVRVLRIPYERDVELYEILRADGSYERMPEAVVNFFNMNRNRPEDYNKEPAAQLTVGLWKALAEEPDLQNLFKRSVYKGKGYMYIAIHGPYADPITFDGLVYASVRLHDHPSAAYFKDRPLGLIEPQRIVCKREADGSISLNDRPIRFDGPSDEAIAEVLASMREKEVAKYTTMQKTLAEVGLNVDLSQDEVENGLRKE